MTAKTSTKKPRKRYTPGSNSKLPKWQPRSNGKHPGGRPLIWTPELMAKIGHDLLAYLEANPGAVSIPMFCHQYDPPFSYDQISPTVGAKGYEEFSLCHSRAREIVTERLIVGGIVKDQPFGKDGSQLCTRLDTRGAIFVLSARHGLVEKSEQSVALKGNTGVVVVALPVEDKPPK